jgi:hypothetical protein
MSEYRDQILTSNGQKMITPLQEWELQHIEMEMRRKDVFLNMHKCTLVSNQFTRSLMETGE